MEFLSPQSPLDEKTPREHKPPFNVVIAYEDFAAGRHAKETYDYLVRSLGRELAFDNQMWKFDVLGHPKLREMAVKDAAAADLIMISTHGDGDLPAEVKSWIDGWANHRGSAMALVKLTDRNSARHPHDDIIRSYLEAVAHRVGMDFFAQPDEWPDRDEDFSLQQISERAQSTSSLMASFLNHSAAGWRWGLKG
jgi:hypothetical protein